jgi:hypothetical protein
MEFAKVGARDTPPSRARRTADQPSLVDFVADDTADNGTTYRSDRAATGQYSTTDRANSCADGRILFLLRHTGTTTQANQHCRGECTKRKFTYHFHVITSFSNIEFQGASCLV